MTHRGQRRARSRLHLRNVVAYGGHRIYAAPGAEKVLGADMDDVLREHCVGAGFGSLACGADILWAEALLRRDAELHLFVPGSDKQFISKSVEAGGSGWVARFDALLGAATSVARIPRHSGPWDKTFRETSDAVFTAAIEAARLRQVQVTLVEVWDGSDAAGPAGTAADIATWRRMDLPLHLVGSRGKRVKTAQ